MRQARETLKQWRQSAEALKQSVDTLYFTAKSSVILNLVIKTDFQPRFFFKMIYK